MPGPTNDFNPQPYSWLGGGFGPVTDNSSLGGGIPNFAPSSGGIGFNPSSDSGGGNWFSNLSPQTQTALLGTGTSLLGGYLSQRNTNSQNDLQRQLQQQLATQSQVGETQRLAMQLQQSRALQQAQMGVQGQNMDPSRQNWRQQQAILADILPGLRNAQVTPPGNLARFMPQMSGGLRLPEGGLSKEALAFFSPQARLSAEQALDRQLQLSTGGQYIPPDYSGVGYGAAGQGANQQSAMTLQAQQHASALAQALGQTGALNPRTAAGFQQGAVRR